MPFIPHTEQDIREMLDAIGVDSIAALFDEIPANLRAGALDQIPPGMSEMEVTRLMHARAGTDNQPLNFIGAGAYEHHIPAAVWEITTRGEFYSAYTPYQAEASQGTLQVLYEYQTMMSSLTSLDVSNASLYDGATALAEAVLMAVRANRKSNSKRVLLPRTVHPLYREVARTVVHNQGIELVEIDYDRKTGIIDPASLAAYAGQDIAALVIPQPNFFGCLEDVDALTDWAATNGAISIGVANPTTLALLSPPGQWGTNGVDIACGEGQPLGIPLSSGGPYFGFMCCKQQHVRQMPGRIIGKTLDLDGRDGFTLTLQAREQHIRRSKATSNICTNQGLMVTAATIYMALLGPEGLERVAATSAANARSLVQGLSDIDGIRPLFDRPYFHEVVLSLPRPAAEILPKLNSAGVLGGLDLTEHYPELGNALLVCTTETKTPEDLQQYQQSLRNALAG